MMRKGFPTLLALVLASTLFPAFAHLPPPRQGQAALPHEAVALFRRGHAYERGLGQQQSFMLAAHWYRKAAEQGHAPAQNNLAILYETGRGVVQDHAQAALWYLRAASQGWPRPQTNLGSLYEAGRGVAKDPAQAALWYRRAARQGYAQAQYRLGRLLHRGPSPDYRLALRWYRAAAHQGHAEAQLALREMTVRGQGVSCSPSGHDHDTRLAVPGSAPVRHIARQLTAALQTGWRASLRADHI